MRGNRRRRQRCLFALLGLNQGGLGILGRFARDAGVRPFIKGKVNGNALQLKSKASLARYRTLFRDLGYLIELEE